MTMIERLILLEALIKLWEDETNENVLEPHVEIERLIAWQVLAISGAYDRHSEYMRIRREKPIA